MQSTLNTLDTKELVDYDNLNIVTRPRPPRRRQSGISLVPFRPYVKCLSSVRQPFSFANGYDKWMVTGSDEVFFTQPNARCIGSLIDDCDISDVIRWDIEGESTRLPMMCKLWMIVDGAVVERGKPHLVQDAAVQVFSAGRNLRAIIAAQQRYGQVSTSSTSDRRRRQSWHDVNEYHSVPYYQYTTSVHAEFQKSIQCDMDNEQSTSKPEVLSDVEEETVDDENIKDYKRENLRETIHHPSLLHVRAHVSITTQTESRFNDRSTSIDLQFIRMFNLNLETNELLLSSIVNPYQRALSSTSITETISFYRHGIEYKHRAISTGDDFPHWWLRLTTDLLLSDSITNQTEEKEKPKFPPPSPRQDQSVQTDLEKSRPTSSTRSSRIPKSSSSTTTSTHYEFIDEIDDGNNAKRILTYSGNNSHRIGSHSSDGQFENVSIHNHRSPNRQLTLSKHSDSDYHTFITTLNEQQQSYSTPEHHHHHHTRVICPCSSNDITRVRTKTSESTTTVLLASLLERYEKTLRERQRAMAIANEQLVDIDDVLRRYRGKTENSAVTTQSNTAMELYRDISFLSTQSKEDRPSITITNLIKDKYREMPEITSKEMIQGYIPSPRLHLTNTIITTPRQRQPRFVNSSKVLVRPDYCDLCLIDHNTSSAWIRYNERRIEELHKRIDLMLQIDDNEEAHLLLSTPTNLTTATVSQRIDDAMMRRPRYRSRLLHYPDHISKFSSIIDKVKIKEKTPVDFEK
jgi:hypothetical protein